jgi:hypothetical protein
MITTAFWIYMFAAMVGHPAGYIITIGTALLLRCLPELLQKRAHILIIVPGLILIMTAS